MTDKQLNPPADVCKWYYDDSLAASWMAKHFEMQFQFSHYVAEPAEISLNWILMHMGNAAEGLQVKKRNFYIHPDSLSLLEPQDGDVCELAGDDQYFSNISGDFAEFYMEYVGYDNPIAISLNAIAELRDEKSQISKIIWRNGHPFHWPSQDKGE